MFGVGEKREIRTRAIGRFGVKEGYCSWNQVIRKDNPRYVDVFIYFLLDIF